MTDTFIKALAFAADKHRNQRRKDAEASPYINHPIALADVLANEGGVTDISVLCAAMLHDTIEDTETSEQELRERFGEKVTSIVLEVTDNKSLLPPVRKQLQIDHASYLSNEAKLVKLADKICNLRDILASPPEDWSLERKRNYFDWAKQVADQIGDASKKLNKAFDEVYAKRP
jgi:guanosine-3',5'-bis(diphosphate) 3'-pyrophosphohydrolase